MKKFIAWLALLIGVLLVIFAWVLGYADTPALWQDFVVGLMVIAVSLVAALGKGRLVARDWPFLLNLVLGLWLVVSGIFVFGREATANRVVDIVLGVLLILLSATATQVVEGRKGYVYTKDGDVLLEMSRLGYKAGVIEAKGKAYGSMPQTMRIPPDQIWNLIGLVPVELIVRLPKLVFLGWKASRSPAGSKDDPKSTSAKR
ncbi:MAG: SPW repeat protein [Thermoleophilia bacterium]|nr:SPW repeat protein [Thermoleophilia bacterium]